jgi:putative ABC transport system permease protein
MSSLPDVTDVASVMTVPLSGSLAIRDFTIEGRPALPAGQLNDAEFQVISPSYFHVMGIPLLKGRLFTDRDNQDGPPATIINDAMANRYWPGEDPVGRRLEIGEAGEGEADIWLTVIGVVGDIRETALGVPPYPQMYTSFRQSPQRSAALIIKSRTDPNSMINEVREQIAAIDPGQPLYHVAAMTDVMANSLSRQRFNTQLMLLLTLIAFALTIVGIYGVASYIATQRTNEIGIRMALGARRGQIAMMMAWKGIRIAMIGVAAGLAAAMVLSRYISGLLYSTSALDTGTFMFVPLVVLGAAAAASYIPARRAASIDPVAALRHE